MKKLLLLTAAALMLAVSCDDGHNGVSQRTVVIDARREDWKPWPNDPLVDYYVAEFGVPAITGHVCDHGTVSVYIYDGDKQAPLPYTRYYEGTVNGQYHTWSETIDYTFERGMIYLYVSFSDFIYNPADLNEPGAKSFRIVVAAD